MNLKKDTLWSVLPLAVVTVLNIVSVPLFLRFLGPDRYALWFYVLALSGSFGFVDLGLGVAVGRYVGVALGQRNPDAAREYWATGHAAIIPLLLSMSGVFIGIGVLLGPRWYNVQPADASLLQWCFVAGGISLFLNYYGQLWLILLQAHLDFAYIGVVKTLAAMGTLIPALCIARMTHNPFHLLLWSTGMSCVQTLAFLARSRMRHRFGLERARISLARAREMFVYTAKSFANLLVSSFTSGIDRIILGKYASAVSFSAYNIATNLGARVLMLGSAVAGPVFHNTSRASGNSSRDVARVYDTLFHLVFAWALSGIVWLVLWNRPILDWWLGSEFAGHTAPILVPLFAGYCLRALSAVSGSQLASLNRMGTSLLFSSAAAVLSVAGVVLGWKSAGIVGAACGFMLSQTVWLIQDLLVLRLVKAKGWFSPRVWQQIALHGAAGGVLCAVKMAGPAGLLWPTCLAIAHGAVLGVILLRSTLSMEPR